jgi:hypothetical protein
MLTIAPGTAYQMTRTSNRPPGRHRLFRSTMRKRRAFMSTSSKVLEGRWQRTCDYGRTAGSGVTDGAGGLWLRELPTASCTTDFGVPARWVAPRHNHQEL